MGAGGSLLRFDEKGPRRSWQRDQRGDSDESEGMHLGVRKGWRQWSGGLGERSWLWEVCFIALASHVADPEKEPKKEKSKVKRKEMYEKKIKNSHRVSFFLSFFCFLLEDRAFLFALSLSVLL